MMTPSRRKAVAAVLETACANGPSHRRARAVVAPIAVVATASRRGAGTAVALVALAACSSTGLRVWERDAAPPDVGVAATDAGRDTPLDATVTDAVDARVPDIASEAPRLVAPLSTSAVTSRTPTLRWVLPRDQVQATVELCADRACSEPLMTLTGSTSARPPSELSPGWVFWRVTSGMRTSATWQLRVGLRSAPVDTSWGTVLDVNGDGYVDEVARIVMGGESHSGVFHGTPMGLAPEPATVIPPSPCNSLAVAESAGDIDGDGYGDLLLRENADWCRPGNVRVFRGGPTGVATSPQWTLEGPDRGVPGFGRNAISAGDLDGDGFGDLVVGTQGYLSTDRLAAEVWFGSAAGIVSARGLLLDFGLLSIRSELPPMAAGDLDGDGLGDLAVGTSIYLGRTSGFGVAAFTFDRFVKACATGDFDGDGRADWAVSSDVIDPAIEIARVSVFHGAAGGIETSPRSIFMGEDQYYGRWMWTGDFDEDGFDDLAVVAPPATTLLYYGSPAGLTAAE